uniref:SERTA domain containing 2 n=1 Tax=Oryzias latipes TaxID=8090 RepID=A0A3P9HHH0_ORYLA
MRYMFCKGAKRKLDEDEEGVEGKTMEGSLAGGGLENGPEGLSKVSYTLQRQTIFNISLMKLYSQRPLTEPRLERRVLINNMLRRIQEELKQEGSLRPLFLPPSPPPDDPMDEGFREAPPSFGNFSVAAPTPQPSPVMMPAMAPPLSPHPMVPPICQAPPSCPPHVEASASPLEACLTPASLLEEDGGDPAFCSPSPPTPPLSPPPAPPPLALVGSSSSSSSSPSLLPVLVSSNDTFCSDRMDLTPPTAITRTAANTTTMSTSPAITQTPQLAVPSETPPDRDLRTVGAKPEAAAVFLVESRCAEFRQMDVVPTVTPCGLVDAAPSHSVPPSSSSGFLSDLALDDVLFADIDTSMYDFDACTAAGATGATTAAGLTKRAPDDLLKSMTLPYSGSAPQVSANQPFKIDLTELDHIMEVLVGS